MEEREKGKTVSMEINITLSRLMERKLLVVAQKASGQDAPSALQITNTFCALAEGALHAMYEKASKPEPVNTPLPPLVSSSLKT
jgi:hypothetical protein